MSKMQQKSFTPNPKTLHLILNVLNTSTHNDLVDISTELDYIFQSQHHHHLSDYLLHIFCDTHLDPKIRNIAAQVTNSFYIHEAPRDIKPLIEILKTETNETLIQNAMLFITNWTSELVKLFDPEDEKKCLLLLRCVEQSAEYYSPENATRLVDKCIKIIKRSETLREQAFRTLLMLRSDRMSGKVVKTVIMFLDTKDLELKKRIAKLFLKLLETRSKELKGVLRSVFAFFLNCFKEKNNPQLLFLVSRFLEVLLQAQDWKKYWVQLVRENLEWYYLTVNN